MPRTLIPCLLLAACAPAASPAAPPGSSASPDTRLPHSARDILFVGDSVTAGVHFMALSDSSAAQAWPAAVAEALGFALPPARFPEPYPLDFVSLAREGLGIAGWRFPWSALPALGKRRPRFRPGEARPILAVPGQTLTDFLEERSGHHRPGSTGWIFASFLLPEDRTAVGTLQASPTRPSWVLVFLGANDLLARFGLVGDAEVLAPDGFGARMDELLTDLRDAMDPAAPPSQLLVATLPDVTALPFLQPLPHGARWADGSLVPDGSRTSAFLLRYRRERFDATEVWTPQELERVREDQRGYNAAIERAAARHGATCFDVAGLLADLAADPAFATVASPWFSPDLNHPSLRTHRALACLALGTMARVTGEPAPPLAPPAAAALPSAADLDDAASARRDALMRIAFLGMEAGVFPPRPTLRVAIEAFGETRDGRRPAAAAGVQLAAESAPGPFDTRRLTRGVLAVRLDGTLERGSALRASRGSWEVRAGLGIEPIGAWHWTHAELGLAAQRNDPLGWYARMEYRALVVETAADDWAPRRLRLGLRWGTACGRPGHDGN